MRRYHTGFSALIRYLGEDQAFLLTFTFPYAITEWREAQHSWHSIASNVVNKKYPVWLRVAERDREMRWHFHVVVFSTEPLTRALLKKEQEFWSEKATHYHFGRTEIELVRDWAALRQYLKKDFQHRKPCDRGAKLVTASRKAKAIMAGKAPNWK